MQAIKDKLNGMNEMRKAKAGAKEQEKVEKISAKARLEVAHEVRLAREAEAAMDLHLARAGEKMMEHARKHPQPSDGDGSDHPALTREGSSRQNSHRIISISPLPEYNLTDGMSGGGYGRMSGGGSDRMSGGGADISPSVSVPRDNTSVDSNASNSGTPNGGGDADGPPNKILL
ncbi:hypothetical protein Salat_2720000 [Sesamum alatum]|uniref:Uncharacterized protein n=1 Tax=Sesamum alatum TaxID=300844 RepID=A0AAE1XQK0_9LAMI|nr:hypothetical protein Salat_2720000 [Sesamum alatum]